MTEPLEVMLQDYLWSEVGFALTISLNDQHPYNNPEPFMVRFKGYKFRAATVTDAFAEAITHVQEATN